MRKALLISFTSLLLAACGGGASFNAGGQLNQAPTPPAAPEPPKAPEAPKPTEATKPTETAPKPALAEVSGEDIKVNGKILFETASAKLDAADDPILDEVAKIMKDHKEIELVEIEGHADHQGDAKQNVTLTDNRAKSVVEALVKRGVEKNRLTSKGYGEYCPIEQGDTPAAHEANRRVVFKILKHNGKATNVATGCAEAEKKGIKPAKL